MPACVRQAFCADCRQRHCHWSSSISLHHGKPRARPVALIPKKIRYGGQPLEIGVPGAGLDRRQAVRAWEIAVRLREQAARFRVVWDIPDAFPESKLGLEVLEAGIQTTAKWLAVATNICGASLEGLIDALERYNSGVRFVRPWQV